MIAHHDMRVLSMLERYAPHFVLADDVAYELGLRSSRSACQRLRRLARRGLVEVSSYRRPMRGWRIAEAGREAVAATAIETAGVEVAE